MNKAKIIHKDSPILTFYFDELEYDSDLIHFTNVHVIYEGEREELDQYDILTVNMDHVLRLLINVNITPPLSLQEDNDHSTDYFEDVDVED